MMVVIGILTAMFSHAQVNAQCTGQWLPGAGVPGVSVPGPIYAGGAVYASVLWDPDGAGPLPPVLVVAGHFPSVTTTSASNIAMWNGTSWSALGAGLNDYVYALAVDSNNNLIAAGSFTMAGGVPANRIAKWNGAAWSALGAGTGLDSTVYALKMYNGNLIAGGHFGSADGVAGTFRIASWNGSAWSSLGGVGVSDDVETFAVTSGGALLAGGRFKQAGNPAFVTVNRVASWNGTAWSALGTGAGAGVGSNTSASDQVYALAQLPNGDIIATGSFALAGGNTVNNIARFSGGTWSALEPIGLAGSIGDVPQGVGHSLMVLSNGNLLVGGQFFQAGGGTANNVAIWNGAAWSTLGTGMNSSVDTLTLLSNGNIFAGGDFNTANGVTATGMAQWNGSAWLRFGSGTSNAVSALITMPNGDIVAGGTFRTIEGVAASGIARSSGSTWTALGTGIPGSFGGGVSALQVMPNGDIAAGGGFASMGGTPTSSSVATWNGSTWAAVGTGGVANNIKALAALPDGTLVAGGGFTTLGGNLVNYIASWDGSNWNPLSIGANNEVDALKVLSNGDLIAGGYFSTIGGTPVGKIARYSGGIWSDIECCGPGSGLTGSTVRAIAVMPNGDIIAGGSLTSSIGISRWDGNNWSALDGLGLSGFVPGLFAETTVNALAVMPNGDLIAAGNFTSAGGVAASCIARWNGSTWSALGSGLDNAVAALAVTPSGVLVVGGSFTTAGGASSAYLARWADCAGVCCQTNGTCTLATPGSQSATCASGALVVNGVCSPNTCSQPAGICCRGATCNASVSQADCTVTGAAAGAVYVTSGSACNAGGNYTSPCCYSDYNKSGTKTVSDIFNYLTDWFAHSPYAVTGGTGTGTPTVAHIFNFLSAWFGGGC